MALAEPGDTDEEEAEARVMPTDGAEVEGERCVMCGQPETEERELISCEDGLVCFCFFVHGHCMMPPLAAPEEAPGPSEPVPKQRRLQ